jgi:EmrB/QacA subfamily drug resistance transporter
MIVLDGTIVVVALPPIQRDLHFSQVTLTWVVNAYLITFGGFLLSAGRLGDLIGRRKVFLGGLSLFTAASIVCGLAGSQDLLIGARLAQGVGGAVASSVIVAMVVTAFPEAREQGKAIGIFSCTASAGGSLGLIVGGVLTQVLSWHWIFFINVPIGVVAIVLTRRLTPESQGAGPRSRVDVIGAGLVTLGMMVGIYAIVNTDAYGWGSVRTLLAGAIAVALLGLFIVSQAKIRDPLVPLAVLRRRAVLAPNLVRGLLYVGLFGQFYLGTLYLQRVERYGAIDTGLAFLPLTLLTAGISVVAAARLTARFGARRVLVPGLLCVCAGLAVFSRAPVHASYWLDLFPGYTLLGIGAGTTFVPTIALAMSSLPPRDAGLASGLVNVSQQLAAAVGVAVLGTVSASRTDSLLAGGLSRPAALTAGYHLAITVAIGCVAAGLVVTLLAIRPRDPLSVVQRFASEDGESAGEPAVVASTLAP